MAEVAEDRSTPAGTPEQPEPDGFHIHDRRALALLLSLIFFLVTVPILERKPLGELVLIASLYAMLVTAVLQLAALEGKRWLILLGILLAGASMTFILLSNLRATRPLIAINQCLLILFFSMIVVGSFKALGRPGTITRARLYLSVSVYLLLGMVWFAGYRLIEALHPGSFLLMGTAGPAPVSRGLLLYLSLSTLTAVGSGDVLPVAPVARMVTALEAATGVLYVAITIARLVSVYQPSSRRSG